MPNFLEIFLSIYLHFVIAISKLCPLLPHFLYSLPPLLCLLLLDFPINFIKLPPLGYTFLF